MWRPLAVGGWYYAHLQQFERLAAVRRVAAAETFAAARSELAWFEQGADADERLRTLVEAWGRGDPRFDFYLARYVGHPRSSESLRKAFSRELAWREELLPRWAHYWTWQAKLEPDAQIASICDYLDALAQATPVPAIAWREVLDLQAILVLGGKPSLALAAFPGQLVRSLSAMARVAAAAGPTAVKRPAKPLPDWEGPVETSSGGGSWLGDGSRSRFSYLPPSTCRLTVRCWAGCRRSNRAGRAACNKDTRRRPVRHLPGRPDRHRNNGAGPCR